MSIEFITTFQVKVLTENMFGEVVQIIDEITTSGDERIEQVVEELYAPLSFTIEGQRTHAERIF